MCIFNVHTRAQIIYSMDGSYVNSVKYIYIMYMHRSAFFDVCVCFFGHCELCGIAI